MFGFEQQWSTSGELPEHTLYLHLFMCHYLALQVSGSHDHSLRVWERTREPLVLSEQREIVSRVVNITMYTCKRRDGSSCALIVVLHFVFDLSTTLPYSTFATS